MSEQLPKLIDCTGLQRELGVKRAAAEAIMRDLAKVTIPGHSKVYVKRADVHAPAMVSTDAEAVAFVYVLDCDPGVKVGLTIQTVEERLADLGRASGLIDVRVVRTWPFPSRRAARLIEQGAHRSLRESRTVGEWFHCHPLEACAAVERCIRFPLQHLVDDGRVAA